MSIRVGWEGLPPVGWEGLPVWSLIGTAVTAPRVLFSLTERSYHSLGLVSIPGFPNITETSHLGVTFY